MKERISMNSETVDEKAIDGSKTGPRHYEQSASDVALEDKPKVAIISDQEMLEYLISAVRHMDTHESIKNTDHDYREIMLRDLQQLYDGSFVGSGRMKPSIIGHSESFPACPSCGSHNLGGLMSSFFVALESDGVTPRGEWNDWSSESEMTEYRVCYDCGCEFDICDCT